jgi:hypothetical protein
VISQIIPIMLQKVDMRFGGRTPVILSHGDTGVRRVSTAAHIERITAMKTEPQQEHHWLEKFVGDWTFESECNMGPDQPAMKSGGSERVRSMGGLWVLGEGKGDMPDGSPCTMMLTLGYDPDRKRYIGSWIGSMMAKLWLYDGEVDASGHVLTLNTEGPTFEGDGKTAQYKDVHEFKSRDERVLTSHMLGADGKWTQFMSATYRRTN